MSPLGAGVNMICIVLIVFHSFTIMAQPVQNLGQDNVLRVGILRRPPFSGAEERIMSTFAQKHGLSKHFVYVRSFPESATLISNGSLDIASSGLMTDSWIGKGNNGMKFLRSLIISKHSYFFCSKLHQVCSSDHTQSHNN